MKVGFATRDSVHINDHFGSASQIEVYEVNTRGSTFLETLRFQDNLKQDGNEDKLTPKVRALDDCSLVYVAAIGGSAASRLLGKSITPVKTDSETDEVQFVLAKLVEILNNSPPPWLRKALSKRQASPADDWLARKQPDNRFEDDPSDIDIFEEEIAV